MLVAIASLIGLWIFDRELRRSGIQDRGLDAGIAGLVGGLLGAKLLWVIEHRAEDPFSELLLARGGLSWFGGFFGGTLAGLVLMRVQRLPIVAVLAAATPALTVGHAIGRIGCFLVGDDYGRPSDLPWAVAFPEGLPPTDVPVHPTQLYEAILLIPITMLLLRWRRQGVPDRKVLGAYLVSTGSLRFAIEFIRVNVRILGPLTTAHISALAAVAIGLVLFARRPAPARP